MIRSQSKRHLVAEISWSGKVNTTKQTDNRCLCRRISRLTMGGRDGLLSLTFTYSLMLPSAAGGAIVLQCLSFVPTVPPAGFLPIRGCPSRVPGFVSETHCSNISSSLELVYSLGLMRPLLRHEITPVFFLSLSTCLNAVLYLSLIIVSAGCLVVLILPKLLPWSL